ncbi:MAG: bifunctional phosphoribosylaminoimidazolecarboxamide formyltransferase/IMP cyclohydrolase [Thermoplasmata archaeon]
MPIKRALISVSDKRGIIEFAKELQNMGAEIISTGGTYKSLIDAGIRAIQISDVTGCSEMLDGRVKTLHPAVHGGILAQRKNKTHMKQLEKLKIKPIDMVVVNLYPFAETISKKEASLEEAIENIDIGGPTLIRAAAKNFEDVIVIVNPDRYNEVLGELKSNNGNISTETKYKLAVEAFGHTHEYDKLIHNYLKNRGERKEGTAHEFPETLSLAYKKAYPLRYGENPHQKAVFYHDIFSTGDAHISNAKQLHGKELSFNNILDTDGALEALREFDEPTAVIVKHATPCGVACDSSIMDAYKPAYATDPISAFGGIVALNRKLDSPTAQEIASTFMEVVVAPGYEADALEILKKKKNLRILEIGETKKTTTPDSEIDIKKVSGGILLQTKDTAKLDASKIEFVTTRKPTKEELDSLLFAWKVVKHVKSNAIVLVKNRHTVGIGAGQTSRVDAVWIAAKKAGDKSKGSVLASDAFFPFRDGIDEAAKAGVTAIIHTGGSIRDQEVIAAANEHNIAMVFTRVRCFRH